MVSNLITTTPLGALQPVWTPGSTGAGRTKRLFFTPATITRFQANWVDPVVTVAGGPKHGVDQWFGASDFSGRSALIDALYYMSNPVTNVARASAAYTKAISGTYQQQNLGFDVWGDPCAFVLDWCYDDLTPTQRSNLIARLETNIPQYISAILTTGYNVHENYHCGLNGFIAGQLAIQGESGATDRSVQLRNAMQNQAAVFNEQIGDGLHQFYPYQDPYWFIWNLAYEICTGNLTGMNYYAGRRQGMVRVVTGDGQYAETPLTGDQVVTPQGAMWAGSTFGGPGNIGQFGPAYLGYMMATTQGSDGLWQWIGNQCAAKPDQATWTYQTDSPMWLGILYWDKTITATSPASIPLKKNYYFSANRAVNFRSHWSTASLSNVDVRTMFVSPPLVGHGAFEGGGLEVHRGMDDLLPKGNTYSAEGGSGRGYVEQDAEEGGHGWHLGSTSTPTLWFANSASSTPDSDGQQMSNLTLVPNVPVTRPNQSVSAGRFFPSSTTFGANATQYRQGEVTCIDFPANEAYGMSHTDITECYDPARVSYYSRRVCAIPGATIGQQTIIIRDLVQLVPGGPNTSAVKWGWFSRQQPAVTSIYPPVLTSGSMNAGIINYNGSAAGITDAPHINTIIPASNLNGDQLANWGVASGGKTYSNNLIIQGSGVNGATITVFDGATNLGTTTADVSTGNWSFATGATLTDATHSFTATQTVGVNPPSAATLAYTVVVAPTISAFNATSGQNSTVSTFTYIADNANKAWSLVNPDSHTLQFELRSGDVSTGGLIRSVLSLTSQQFNFNGGPFITFEFQLVGSVNDQFGSGKFCIFFEMPDILSSLRAPVEYNLGGNTVHTATGGDDLSIDYGHSGNITTPTYVNLYTAPSNLTRSVWHTMDIRINPLNNVTDTGLNSIISTTLDGTLLQPVLPAPGQTPAPLGYFNASPQNTHRLRFGLTRSGGTQTQQLLIRNFQAKHFAQILP